jgi:dimethylargininase
MTEHHSEGLQHAIVRPPGASFSEAITEGALSAGIDVALAQSQHREYCQALAAAGLAVEPLPADENFPDSCFMQDPAVVIDDVAVVGRMGAESRRGEEELVARLLAARFPTHRLAAPATLEGGDVLVLPDRVVVGLSGRTNRAGIDQLAAALHEHGGDRPVHAAPVRDFLHLLTPLTPVGPDTLLVVEGVTPPLELSHLAVLTVPAEEAYAANVLAIGRRVVMPAGYPRTAALLTAHGCEVLPVPMTEFAKANGGVTCLALVW